MESGKLMSCAGLGESVLRPEAEAGEYSDRMAIDHD
jgi:hypothetical protein